MAESPKGASSTVKSKGKSSLLDLDIGDDFLKSLKSMSMGKDDAMDFDFGPISKNKKKTFNFDKEDMDFDLDSGFGKISSFNIDMPDLDMPSPSKNDQKSKGTSKEESVVAGNKKKGDGFKFSFDFELDGFGFGSSQESREKTKNNKGKNSFSFGSSQESREKVNNNKDKDSFSSGSSQESREKAMNDQEKECSSKKSGHEGFGSHLNEDIGTLEDGTAQKHTASEAGMTSTIDSPIDIDKSRYTRKHSLPSNHAMRDNETPKLQSVSNGVAVEKEKSSSQKTISTSTQETDCQVEGTLRSPSESRRDTSGLQEHVNAVSVDVSFLGVGTDVNKNNLLGSDTNYERSVSESSSSEDVAAPLKNVGRRSNFENDKHVSETNKDRTETHSNSMFANATEDKVHDVKVSDENRSAIPVLSASALSKGTAAENLTAGKRGDTGVIRSKFLMPSIKPAAQMQKATSLTETKVSAFGNKRIDPIPQSRSDEKMSQDNKDDETGSKADFTRDARSLPKNNPSQTGSQESFQVLGITVSRVCPPSKSQQTTISTPRSIAVSRNLTITAPILTAKNTPNEGEKPLRVKAAMGTLDTSCLKVSAKLGTNLETSRTVLQKFMKSSKAVEEHGGFKAISIAKENNFTEKLKQMPVNSSMKRKVPETNSDLMILLPSKCLSLSPNGSRGSYEGSERICHKQVDVHEHSGSSNITSEHEHCQISSRDVPTKMNIEELRSSSGIEDDVNIKMAQAFSKDLEDICNLLRKKHEEAKELLVRALVNNNKLLLLNHPVHEEKISLLLNCCHKPSFSYFPNLYLERSCVCLHHLEHTQGSEICCWVDDEEPPNKITIRLT